MRITSDLNGAVVSFNTYAAAALGTDFSNVTIDGVFDWKTANIYDDVASLHASVYSSLPQGTPNDYTKYDYVKFTLPSGKERVLGVPWINAATLQINDTVSYNIVVTNCTAADYQNLRNQLLQGGFTDFTITPV